ncbi:MAG: sulfatase, partial [Gemmatimonadaceae bacterium]
WRAPLDEKQPTLAEAFAQGGYVTAGFAANLFYTTWESGLTRGFVHYEDYRRTWKQVLLSTTFLQTNFFWSIAHNLRPMHILRVLARLDFQVQPMWTSDRKLASSVATEFLGWERTRGARPFFAFLNLYDAHLPYEPPNEWSRKFVTDSSRAVPKEADQDLDVYDGAIAYMDHEVGRILDELNRRGVLDNTVVVITSDHGEAFGEHGLYGHGHSLYLPELHVPLVIRYPARVPAGPRVATAVSLLDLGATLFDLTGLGVAGSIGGTSLAGSWGGAATPHSPVMSEVSAGVNNAANFPVSRGAMRSLIDSTGHYIRNGDDVEELYAYRTDPGELRDLAKGDSLRVAALRRAANQAAGARPTKR